MSFLLDVTMFCSYINSQQKVTNVWILTLPNVAGHLSKRFPPSLDEFLDFRGVNVVNLNYGSPSPGGQLLDVRGGGSLEEVIDTLPHWINDVASHFLGNLPVVLSDLWHYLAQFSIRESDAFLSGFLYYSLIHWLSPGPGGSQYTPCLIGHWFLQHSKNY